MRGGCTRRWGRDGYGVSGRGSPRVALLFDKEATTFFYNCVFNLMDSLMRFVVLHPAARELAGEGESER